MLKNKTFIIVIMVMLMVVAVSEVNAYYVEPNEDYDVYNLRYNARFIVNMGPERNQVVWVPSGMLGKPDTTKYEMEDLSDDLELAKKEINNVYEALMFVHIHLNAFEERNVSSYDYDLQAKTEYPKPPELVLETGGGNCSAISSIVRYLLKDDYSEVGLFWELSNVNSGGGHVINYVRHNGDYYFFDALGVTKLNDSYPIENGDMRGDNSGSIWNPKKMRFEPSGVDWADAVIKASPEQYIEFRHSLSEKTFFSFIEESGVMAAVGFDNIYMPNHYDEDNVTVYVTRENNWDVSWGEKISDVPKEYTKYSIYKNIENSNPSNLDIIDLDF